MDTQLLSGGTFLLVFYRILPSFTTILPPLST